MYFRLQPSRSLLTPLLLAVLLAVTGAHAQGPGQANTTNQPLIRFSTQADEPVIEYRLVHHLLAERDPVPLLRIYGDGQVKVHYPGYMKKAGDYEYHLSRPELDALLRSLSQDGVIDFDHAAVMSERKQLKGQERAAGILHSISDTTETIIDIRLDEYQRGPGTGRIKNLRKRLAWDNLEQDARHFPQSKTIKGAANGAQRLHGLLDHPGMQRVQ